MKYIPLLLLILSGCSMKIEAGHCYFNSRYSAAIKVTKVSQYGFFAEEIKRPASAGVYCGSPEVKPTVYFAWDTVERNGLEDDGIRLLEVDCEAYEEVKKGNAK